MAIRSYGPGKFDHVVDQYVYELANEGYLDEVNTVYDRWHGLIYLGPAALDDIKRIAAERSDTLTPEEEELISKSIGAIIVEDNSGFVSVIYYETAKGLEEAWQEIAYGDEDDDY